MIKDFNIKKLINYLKLDKDNIKILHKEKISNHFFFKLIEEKPKQYGMKERPTTILIEFIKSLSQKL